ncbi:DinB family protein [Hymenobacter sp. GOD-10R]|uniref:DinB family protein n=1 Tax=Hymenobacter sp. GOD-10R TaxID=3093922 RepID=UPI002D7804B0|nr:DinB family protein [Hymenobacter sp. GOD-10R]WRQ29360.1 DinB family protein [Hymenobacter sp. GOD-10R]
MEKHAREALVKELIQLLEGGNAHVPFEEACASIPLELLNKPATGLPYTIWQLVEHVRIAQWDIVEFCINPEHQSPKWPDEYWPSAKDLADQARWETTLAHIQQDKTRFVALLHDSNHDLFEPLAHGTGQNIFREAVLIADHTAYHTGQIILLRRLLNNWS